MENQTIQNLLYHVSALNKKYKEIAEITGENFNVFKILDVSTQEVRMHSALIAELLNAKGSHGRGGIFLNLLLEQQKLKFAEPEFIKKLVSFNVEKSITKVEHHIGLINKDATEGGRIDILITDTNGKHIIIENKIYAGDQNNQLIRYNNSDPNAPIFYLTLDEKIPDGKSIGILKNGKDFVCISYRGDIIKWLESCVKESANFPILRETIQQYIYLIKRLTNQTTNHKMNKEITDILSQNAENLEGTFLIANSLKSVKESLLEKLKEQLLKVANDLNLTMIYGINLDRKYSGFRFSHPNLDIDNLQINFSFEQENTQNLIYGIIAKIRTLKTAENPNGTFINKYKEIFNKSYGVVLKNNAWYSAIGSFENPNWGAKEYAEIMNGEMAKKIEIKVKQILDVFKQLDAERYQFEAIE